MSTSSCAASSTSAASFPQAPGALGVFEFAGQSVLVGAFGVEQSQSISFVLVLHVALLLPITLLGFYYMTRQSIAYRDLIQLEETRASASEQAHELEGPLTDIELVQEGKIPRASRDAQPCPTLNRALRLATYSLTALQRRYTNLDIFQSTSWA